MSEILRGKTVLLVDDEADLREVMKAALDLEGCRTLEAGSGDEAFTIVKEQPVDAIVSDERMSHGTGMDLLAQVKKLSSTKAVFLLVTGFADVPEFDAFHLGACAVLHKPFAMDAVIRAVERALTPPEGRWAGLARVPAHVDIEMDVSSIQHLAQGNMVSLGRGGMFVHLSQHIPLKGEKVSFRIHFKKGTPQLLSGTGIVRWVRSEKDGSALPGCGIEFVDFGEDCRKEVLTLVAHMKNEAYIPRE